MKEPKSDLLNDRRRPPGEMLGYGELFEVNGQLFVVDEPCSSTYGKWYCVPHHHAPHYQENAEAHNTRQCKWVWACMIHVTAGVVEMAAKRRKR